jgi:hypothetical protein
VPANSVKFKFGPDTEMFGIPYTDPYAQNESAGFKLTRAQLRAMILEVLTEGEDEGGDEGGDDLFGDAEGGEDEEGGDEGGEEAGGEESGDKEGGDEGGGEEGGDEEEAADDSEKDEEKEPEPTGPVGDEVDIALKDVMADFEKRALDAAKAKGELKPVDAVKKEGRVSLARLLFEEEETPLMDMGTFAADVARLISNYDSLIDMEAVIYTKAKDFLEKKYGKEYSDQLEDILAREYNIEFDHEYDPEKAEQPIFAVGATAAAAGA